ncbi:hypothetical protein JOD64_004533 [Micromonospora luteifusca]|uniref:DUF3800 domain-containing protein n=1 Tax=Micromonospora luteifusca TaxID=709860 RepID=A0ABS2LYQ5_9ACTN|nr:hypothetical protein [Micromonospora luteifusca]MBM7493311.1 hypothetical protein [Micromonospora luteifusca]
MSKTVAVILDDSHWLWAYDVSLAILAVEVLHVAEAADLESEPWWDDLRRDLSMAVIAQGSLGLEVPAGLTDRQREHLLELLAVAAQRLRARRHITAEEAAEHYVVDQQPVFLRGASSVDTAPVADLAVAVINLIRGDLPPPPPGSTAWFYGDGPPRGL